MSSPAGPQPGRVRGGRYARRRSARRSGWWLAARIAFFTGLGLVAVVVLAFWVAYARTDIPSPSSEVTAQTSVIRFAGGRTITDVGTHHRTAVRLSEVSAAAQQAVLAAEDRNYYSEPGISFSGIGRALWADIRGGSATQGGSTITQQYAKNAYLTQAKTFTRKLREILIAIKLDHSRSKAQVFEDYLNSVYFGRGAYGIQAAAQVYFDLPASQLDAARAAVLAAAIRAPSFYDPARNPVPSRNRWRYVIDGMVKIKALTPAQAAALRYPAVLPQRRLGNDLSGPNGYIVQAVERELADKAHISREQLFTGGYSVVTTIDPKAQDAAVAAERAALGTRAEPLSALVSVQPGSGAIRAMYGGRDFTGNSPVAMENLATQISRQPGSSFKPYTLATALSQGLGLSTTVDGSTPQLIPGWSKEPLNNDSVYEQCNPCSLLTATAESINTAYAHLILMVGTDKVRATAHAAGVTAKLADADGSTGPSLTLGTYGVSPLDQATGYATFAAGGVRASPFLVAAVADATGRVVYRVKPELTRAFSPAVAADATYALSQVIAWGTGTRAALADGRPAAGKTGTASRNADAWFVGFTPQLSTAVWMGNVKESQPLTNVPGVGPEGVYGGGLPAQIWKDYMDAALAGKPALPLPVRAYIGGQPQAYTSPPPSPSRSPSLTPPVTPSASASPSASTPVASSPAASSPTTRSARSRSRRPTSPAAASSPVAVTSAPAGPGPPTASVTPAVAVRSRVARARRP